MKVTDEQFDEFCDFLGIEFLPPQKTLLKKALEEGPLYTMIPRKVFLFELSHLSDMVKVTQLIQTDGYNAKVVTIDDNPAKE